jgi:hypothetical protein
MDDAEHQQLRVGARAYFEATVDHARNVQLSRDLFQIAAANPTGTTAQLQRSAA